MNTFLLVLISWISILVCVVCEEMPAPFYRELKVTSPAMSGNDVLIAQTLLVRDDAVDPSLVADGVYGKQSEQATKDFQAAVKLAVTGVLDSVTAQKLLDLHEADGVKDNGFTAASKGYMYKFHIPVHKNRSIETTATLFDKDNNVLLKFTVRTHGIRSDGTSTAWPDFGDGDIGYTEFGSSGNTVTGTVEIDLNSPEPNPQVYGPWPVNRIVRGIDGNAKLSKFLLYV